MTKTDDVVNIIEECARQKALVVGMVGGPDTCPDDFILLAGAFADLQNKCNDLRRSAHSAGIKVCTKHFDEDDLVTAVAEKLERMAVTYGDFFTPEKMRDKLLAAKEAGSEEEIINISTTLFVLMGTDPEKFGYVWDMVSPDMFY